MQACMPAWEPMPQGGHSNSTPTTPPRLTRRQGDKRQEQAHTEQHNRHNSTTEAGTDGKSSTLQPQPPQPATHIGLEAPSFGT